MARHYARGADLKPKMRGAVEAFEKSVNERRKLSNPAEELSKLKSRECDLSENRIRINVLFGGGGGTRTPRHTDYDAIINFKDKQFQQLESVQLHHVAFVSRFRIRNEISAHHAMGPSFYNLCYGTREARLFA